MRSRKEAEQHRVHKRHHNYMHAHDTSCVTALEKYDHNKINAMSKVEKNSSSRKKKKKKTMPVIKIKSTKVVKTTNTPLIKQNLGSKIHSDHELGTCTKYNNLIISLCDYCEKIYPLVE